MRILYVSSEPALPAFGTSGRSVRLRELSHALAALGHDVRIVASNTGGERGAGFTVPVTPRRPPDFRPDVVYEHFSGRGGCGLGVARRLGTPFALELTAPLPRERNRRRAAAAHRVLHAADRVVAATSSLARSAERRDVDASRIVVVPSAVDVDFFRVGEGERVRVRAALGVGAEEHLLGLVGTLGRGYDIDALLHAVARLRGAGIAARLLLVGDGPERQAAEIVARAVGIADVTTFTGAVAHEVVPSLLTAVDIAAAPYRPSAVADASPLALFEYLAAARPVVAADVGDVRHCVLPGATGQLYEPGDDARLAAAVGAVLTDDRHATSYGLIGREHVRGHHSWKRSARRLSELFETLVASRTNGSSVTPSR